MNSHVPITYLQFNLLKILIGIIRLLLKMAEEFIFSAAKLPSSQINMFTTLSLFLSSLFL